MATISVSVSEDLRAKAESQAARHGHTSIEDYVRALLRDDLEPDVDNELEGELIKGLESPAEEMSESDWDAMRVDWDAMRVDLLRRHGEDMVNYRV